MGKRDKDYVLSGSIELDDAYLGAPKSNGKRAEEQIKPVCSQQCRSPNRCTLHFLKIQISQLDAKSVSVVAQHIIRAGSKIQSDALGSYRAALQGAYIHYYQVFDKGNGALRWVHTPISNVKSFLSGTYHGLGKKHL